MLLEALIAWVGSLSALVVICKTLLVLANLHYRDKEKVRLDRLDRQMHTQIGSVDETGVLDKIVNLADTRFYPYQIGEGVIDELKKNGLITNDRASYIRIAAEKNRGPSE